MAEFVLMDEGKMSIIVEPIYSSFSSYLKKYHFYFVLFFNQKNKIQINLYTHTRSQKQDNITEILQERIL